MITLTSSFSLTWHPALRACFPEGQSGKLAQLVESEINSAAQQGREVVSRSPKPAVALNGFGAKKAVLTIAGKRVDVSDRTRSSTLAVVRLNDALHELTEAFPGLKIESIDVPAWVGKWANDMVKPTKEEPKEEPKPALEPVKLEEQTTATPVVA